MSTKFNINAADFGRLVLGASVAADVKRGLVNFDTVRLEFTGETLAAVATDRYVLAHGQLEHGTGGYELTGDSGAVNLTASAIIPLAKVWLKCKDRDTLAVTIDGDSVTVTDRAGSVQVLDTGANGYEFPKHDYLWPTVFDNTHAGAGFNFAGKQLARLSKFPMVDRVAAGHGGAWNINFAAQGKPCLATVTDAGIVWRMLIMPLRVGG